MVQRPCGSEPRTSVGRNKTTSLQEPGAGLGAMTARVAALTVGMQRGLERRGALLHPFIDSFGPADVFAVFEAVPASCSDASAVVQALGGNRPHRSVQVRYLTEQEEVDATVQLATAQVCCLALKQFHKLAIAMEMVQQRELKIGAYAFVMKFRHPLLRIRQLVVDAIPTDLRVLGIWAQQLIKLRLRLRNFSCFRLRSRQSLSLVHG